jgi:type I restriction enzyme, S subunit
MNADRLLEHYERIADAPDAIPRLRRFILDLAVRGKLVPQEPQEEPALELLKRIAKEKAWLVKAGQIRSPKPSAPVRDEELPISVPKTWVWLRLHDIGVLSGGMTPSMNRSDFWGGEIVWLSPKDIKADEVSNSELKITAEGLSETRLETYRPGSLFMVARSGILKRIFPVSINRVSAAANQDMKVLVPFLDGQERYLQIMFRGLTDFILREMVKTGTTVQSLKYAEFEQQPFPLPPLAEQHRIVAKVDAVMALCARLEAARAGGGERPARGGEPRPPQRARSPHI